MTYLGGFHKAIKDKIKHHFLPLQKPHKNREISILLHTHNFKCENVRLLPLESSPLTMCESEIFVLESTLSVRESVAKRVGNCGSRIENLWENVAEQGWQRCALKAREE